jgi:MerR-like DNA binding protein
MLRIGEFAALAHTSVKTLRFYDETGVFRPAHTDRYPRCRLCLLKTPLPRREDRKDSSRSLFMEPSRPSCRRMSESERVAVSRLA